MSRRPFSSTWAHTRLSSEERRVRREDLRKQIFEKQNGLCWLCGKVMTLELPPSGRPNRTYATFDHVRPKSDGGTTYFTNLKLAHRACNSARPQKFPDIHGAEQ